MRRRKKHVIQPTPGNLIARNKKKRYYVHSPASEEGHQMTEVLERFRLLEVPPHVTERLGLSNDWKERITEDFAKKVFVALEKHQDALRKLRDY